MKPFRARWKPRRNLNKRRRLVSQLVPGQATNKPTLNSLKADPDAKAGRLFLFLRAGLHRWTPPGVHLTLTAMRRNLIGVISACRPIHCSPVPDAGRIAEQLPVYDQRAERLTIIREHKAGLSLADILIKNNPFTDCGIAGCPAVNRAGEISKINICRSVLI